MFLRKELLDFTLELNNKYPSVQESCRKKEWKIFDNLHNQLNVIENNRNQKIKNHPINTPAFNKDYLQGRAVDMALKIYFTIFNG